MKKLFAIAALLVATGAAHAQVIPDSYTSANGKNFNIASDRSFECAPGYVKRVYAYGSASTSNDFTDAGSLCTKMIQTQPNAVRVLTTQRYLNPRAIDYTSCKASGSYITYLFGSGEDFAGDGCQVHQAYTARTTK